MAEEQVPQWIRLKHEIESLWRGAWAAIHDLEDRLSHLEKRQDRMEQTLDEMPVKTRITRMFHLPGLDLHDDED